MLLTYIYNLYKKFFKIIMNVFVYRTEIIQNKDGSKFFYLNSKLHRENGPAIVRSNGSKYWLINGEFHREDGPAIEYADGDVEWYLNDVYYSSKDDHSLALQKNEFLKKL